MDANHKFVKSTYVKIKNNILFRERDISPKYSYISQRYAAKDKLLFSSPHRVNVHKISQIEKQKRQQLVSTPESKIMMNIAYLFKNSIYCNSNIENLMNNLELGNQINQDIKIDDHKTVGSNKSATNKMIKSTSNTIKNGKFLFRS